MTTLSDVTDCLIARAMDVQVRKDDGSLSLACIEAMRTQLAGYQRFLDREAAGLSEHAQETAHGA